jgi:hypothetical protein
MRGITTAPFGRFFIVGILIHFFLIDAVTHSSVSQSKFSSAHGTFISYEFFPDFFIVGSDSKSTVTRAGALLPPQSYCKIIPPSDNTMFFSFDLGTLLDPSNHIIFDVNQAARSAFAQSEGRDLRAVGEAFDKIAGKSLAKIDPRFFAGNLNVKSISLAYFVSNSGDHLMAYRSTIRVFNTMGRTGYNFEGKMINRPPIPLGSIGGHADIVLRHYDPLSVHQTKEEIEKHSATDLIATVDGEADRIEKIVAEVIALGDPLIGGDRIVAILQRGEKFPWYRRPDFCPEH